MSNVGTTNKKPPITESIFSKWTAVGQPEISSDGKYIMYIIYNDPVGTNNRRLIIKSTNTNWQKEYYNILSANFTSDGKWATLQLNRDTVKVIRLGTNKTKYFAHVNSYQSRLTSNGQLLVLHITMPANKLILYNLNTDKEQSINSVVNHLLSDNGKVLLLKKLGAIAGKDSINVELWNINEGKNSTIWKGRNASNFSFSKNGEKLVFTSEIKQGNTLLYEVWYYKKEMDSAIKIDGLSQQILAQDSTIRLANLMPQFSSDENSVFFKLISFKKKDQKVTDVAVEIWHYNDKLLNTNQRRENQPVYYTALVNLDERKKVILIAGKNEIIVANRAEYVLIQQTLGNEAVFESFWNNLVKDAYYLVNLKTGIRTLVEVDIEEGTNLGLSPEGKWIIYFDRLKKSFFSYEVGTRITRDITNSVATNWIANDNDKPGAQLTWMPISRTWLAKDEAVLIYDEFDIWQIDPSCAKAPVNLTNGLGKRDKIKFQLLNTGEELALLSQSKKPTLTLIAFNKINKDNGFYSIKIGSKRNPELLSMGAYFYYWPYIQYDDPPLKAMKADVYLVKRMSSSEAPNFFVTTDFKQFTAVSQVQPQRNFNWITAELIQWKTIDGNMSTGILYKPENFNPDTKYPLIFNYYERKSDKVNLFIHPAVSEDEINIPYFVTNGYLVFTPDIHFKTGYPGESAYNSVESAAKYLSQFPWVDTKKMGLQGHSFGGYQTNYIITRTNLFSCAISTAGLCNLVSFYGSASRNGYPMFWSELDQGRIGKTLWENPEIYVRNSPIFLADKITTPLLIIHNRADRSVPFSQGVEFFNALRRLGKKAWLLQYDDNGHSLEGNSALDYTLRMRQFFDHYLKGLPLPTWMN